MAKSRRKHTAKLVLKLLDLEHSKTAVLDGLTSASSKRSYDHAIREFIDWYCSEGFNHAKDRATTSASCWRTNLARRCEWLTRVSCRRDSPNSFPSVFAASVIPSV
jgi:ferritin